MMKRGFHIWICVVPFLICTSAATVVDQIPNKEPEVDRVFLKQLFRPQLEWMSKYTVDSCKDLGLEFNVTESINDFNVCLTKKLMPRVIGRTPAYFNKTRFALAKIPTMANITEFLPLKDELERMCDVIPDLFNCFLRGFQPWIIGCWEVYYRTTYAYLNNLSRSLCNSQKGIRGLFVPKYLPCLEKYAKVVKHCARQSHLHSGSLCGFIPCLQQFVPKCDIPKVDDFLSRIFGTSQKHSGCPPAEYIFPAESTTPPPEEETTLSPPPEMSTLIQSELESEEETNDTCMILEGRLEKLFYDEATEPAPFFEQLDSICVNWSQAECHEPPVHSGWRHFLDSQCSNLLSHELNGTTDRCIGSRFETRMDRLDAFCNAQKATGLPAMGESGCGQIIESFRNSSDAIESESLSDLLGAIVDECSREPLSAAAQKAEDMGPLIWGIVILPIGILLISVSIHLVTQRRKERSGPDVDSGNSLISIDTKDPNSTDACTIEL